jgi:hypothetical protein
MFDTSITVRHDGEEKPDVKFYLGYLDSSHPFAIACRTTEERVLFSSYELTRPKELSLSSYLNLKFNVK